MRQNWAGVYPVSLGLTSIFRANAGNYVEIGMDRSANEGGRSKEVDADPKHLFNFADLVGQGHDDDEIA